MSEIYKKKFDYVINGSNHPPPYPTTRNNLQSPSGDPVICERSLIYNIIWYTEKVLAS